MRKLRIMLNAPVRDQTTWNPQLGAVLSDLPSPFSARARRRGHYCGCSSVRRDMRDSRRSLLRSPNRLTMNWLVCTLNGCDIRGRR
jgi:hypothetical protein